MQFILKSFRKILLGSLYSELQGGAYFIRNAFEVFLIPASVAALSSWVALVGVVRVCVYVLVLYMHPHAHKVCRPNVSFIVHNVSICLVSQSQNGVHRVI